MTITQYRVLNRPENVCFCSKKISGTGLKMSLTPTTQKMTFPPWRDCLPDISTQDWIKFYPHIRRKFPPLPQYRQRRRYTIMTRCKGQCNRDKTVLLRGYALTGDPLSVFLRQADIREAGSVIAGGTYERNIKFVSYDSRYDLLSTY